MYQVRGGGGRGIKSVYIVCGGRAGCTCCVYREGEREGEIERERKRKREEERDIGARVGYRKKYPKKNSLTYV